MAFLYQFVRPEFSRRWNAPDGSEVIVRLEQPVHPIWNLGITRNGETYRTGDGLGTTIFRRAIQDVKEIASMVDLPYILIGYRTNDGNRYSLYTRMILRAIRRTAWQLIPNPLDPENNLPGAITDFLRETDEVRMGIVGTFILRNNNHAYNSDGGHGTNCTAG